MLQTFVTNVLKGHTSMIQSQKRDILIRHKNDKDIKLSSQ